MNPWIYYGGLFLVFVLLAVGFFQLFGSLLLREKIKDNVGRVYSKLLDQDEKRVKDLELERRRYGNVTGKKGPIERMLDSLDQKIMYSGWGVKATWLNTSTYLVLNVVGGSFIFLITYVLTGNIILAVLFTFSAILFPLMWMINICDTKYKSTENQLSFCVNMVANVSASTNDLLTVFEEIAPYMGEPLRSAMQRAVSVAAMTGDANECIRRLSREIEHPLFIRFVRNLEICARADADYKTIARDFAPQVDRYVKAAERKRAIFANGRTQILLLVVMGLVLIYAACGSLGSGFIETLMEMTTNTFGILVLIVEGMLYISALLYALFGMRR